MISLGPVSKGAAATGYYKTETYYKTGTPEAEAAAMWFGKGARDAGFEGTVDDVAFADLLRGKAPNGQLMGRIRNGEREFRAGEDITFSAPKPVSFVGLVLGDERVIAAHDRAVVRAMEHVEAHYIKTRKSEHGQIETLKADRIIAGLFRHDTSRAMDPQLHTHAVIANMVQVDGNDRYRAIMNDALIGQLKTVDAIYLNELARELHKAGYETERVGPNRLLRIKGVPEHIEQQYSKRREEIAAALEDRNMAATPRNGDLAALATRAAKTGHVDWTALRDAWTQEAREAGWTQDNTDTLLNRARSRAATYLGGVTRDDPLPRGPDAPDQVQWQGKDQTGPQDPDRSSATPTSPAVNKALDFAIQHLSERASVYKREDVAITALGRLDRAGIREINHAIERRLISTDLTAVSHAGQDYLTDKDTIARERAMLAALARGNKAPAPKLQRPTGGGLRNYTRPLSTMIRKSLNDTTLTDGQKDAVLTSLTGKGRFTGVQGYAGTGKTFMLAKLHDYATRHGLHIEGLAPSNEAVRVLNEAIPGSETITARLNRQDYRPGQDDKRRSMLVVDESSMISTADMTRLMAYANTRGFARVVLVGDQKQLDAVGAGAAFAQLQRAGLAIGLMDDIQRQRNPGALASVNFAIAGQVKDAFDRLHRIVNADDITQEAAETWLALPRAQRSDAGVIALTNKVRSEINSLIRDGLKADGVISKDESHISALDPLNLTRAEKGDASSYAIGDVVIPFAALKTKGLMANRQYVVTDRDMAQNTITLSEPGTDHNTTLTLSQSGKASAVLSGNRPARRAFSPGDQVRFTITDKDSGVLNAMRGTVRAITDQSICVQIANGKTIDLDRSSMGAAGMDHAYALTAHGFQGQTVDKIILAISAREQLATQKAFYVGISRARDSATLITNDPGKLADTLERHTGERPAALDALAQKERETAARQSMDQDARQTRADRAQKTSEETGQHTQDTPQNDPEKSARDARQATARETLHEHRKELRDRFGNDLQKTREIGGPNL